MQRSKAFAMILGLGLGLSSIATARVDTLQQGVNGYTGTTDMYIMTDVGTYGGGPMQYGPYANPPTNPLTDAYVYTYENG